MKRFLLVFLLLIMPVACSAGLSKDTGIQGQALIGPMCPVVRQGQECPDQPYQATMTILTAGRKKVVTITTDAGGRFRLLLAPATYILHPQTPPHQPFPAAAEQTFTVDQGQFTQIKVIFDSGIR